jgi:autotransporter-associated beta strand protein
MKLKTNLSTILALATFALVASPLHAATLTWDHNADGTASDGSGIWLDPNKWLDGVTPATWNNATPDNAIIGSGGSVLPGNISLAGGVTVGTATFDNYTGKYQLSGGTLTVNGTLTWGPNTTASGTNDGVEFQSTASLAGDGTIVVNGNYPAIKESGQFNIRTANVSAFTGTWNVRNGVLFTEGASVPSATSNIILNGNVAATDGAVYSSRWGQTLTRNLGTADNQIQVIGNRSGFEGQGTSGLSVQLTDALIGTQKVQWGSANFDPSALILQTPNSNLNGVVVFDTEVDLNGADRTVEVDLNHGDSIIGGVWNDGIAQMSRPITNVLADGNGGLIKEGPGNLVLTADNTYDGGTTVNEGAVRYEKAAAMPSTGTHTFNTGTQLQVRVGGGDDFALAGTGAGTVDGLLSGTGPGTSTVTYSGDVDLMLRGGGTFAGNIPNLGGGGTTTDLWLIDGNYTLSGNNTFSGVLGVGRRNDTARTLTLGSATALAGQPTVVIDTAATAKMNLNGFNATIGQLRLGSNNGGSGGTVEDTVGGGVLKLTNGVFLDSHNDGGGRVNCDTVDLNGTTQTFTHNGNSRATPDLIINADVQNGGLITNATAGQSEIYLNGANTYTGGTTHQAGRLRINGSLADATMSITGGDVAGTGTLTFNISGATVDQVVTSGGSINLTGMTCNVLGTPTVAEYVLIDATGAGSYSGTFTPGSLPAGYSLDYGTTDIVKIVGTPGGSPFDTWKVRDGASGVTFAGDTNGDGVIDGLAFLLGANNPNVDAKGLLPASSETGGDLVMTFSCLADSARGTFVLNLEWDGNLVAPWSSVGVPGTVGNTSPTDGTGTVNFVATNGGTNGEGDALIDIVATINDDTQAAGGTLFGRLKGTE